MHGLAHGIIPDVMDILHAILSHQKRFTDFIAFANLILHDVTSFRLDYFKIKSLPKAAWAGENSMAYMRLFSYLYGMFLSNNLLCTEENETTQEKVLNIRCMLNAFQALISVLMSRNQSFEVVPIICALPAQEIWVPRQDQNQNTEQREH